MASDAFSLSRLHWQKRYYSSIQPGSIKDELSINYCNENKLAMVFTGTRHFKH
jgi:AICAR transformylase/IMP cyclohydrolase PurH